MSSALLAGCAAETVVTMRDGTQYLINSKPDIKSLDGYYEFEDIAGKKVRVRADEVSTIEEEG
ncbi:YgdI/YgdR family lipoprotein [Pseudomonas sp. LS44]|uniref:YgdI/YgdR family lipoprotein n=1 Tax=Pseudomonas sp. LS44 TaxID=1357074 RepID=UPI00215A24B9|nr:YgdI/YgdR family lipoprotein [Pseudomonas sp. LS44]UVE17261.1 YgdI/YgdR family lipoprotein [Pseudomonas sp. LS44]